MKETFRKLRLPVLALVCVMTFVGAPRAEAKAKAHYHYRHAHDSYYFPYVYPYSYEYLYGSPAMFEGGYYGGHGGGQPSRTSVTH